MALMVAGWRSRGGGVEGRLGAEKDWFCGVLCRMLDGWRRGWSGACDVHARRERSGEVKAWLLLTRAASSQMERRIGFFIVVCGGCRFVPAAIVKMMNKDE